MGIRRAWYGVTFGKQYSVDILFMSPVAALYSYKHIIFQQVFYYLFILYQEI